MALLAEQPTDFLALFNGDDLKIDLDTLTEITESYEDDSLDKDSTLIQSGLLQKISYQTLIYFLSKLVHIYL